MAERQDVFTTKYGEGDYDGLADFDYDMGEWGLKDCCEDKATQCIHVGIRNFSDGEKGDDGFEPDYEIQLWVDDAPTYYSTNHLGNAKSMYRKTIKMVEGELDKCDGGELSDDAWCRLDQWLVDAGKEWADKQHKKAFSKRVNNWLKGMGINKEIIK
tara:strand:- start:40 stop:510 length:471 start_codon:yes stop_codon:yes gene_type:complete